jgi:hypothetical protein
MHNSTSGTEVVDRLAMRELIEAYARCVDRRDATGQMALFTADRNSFRLVYECQILSACHGLASPYPEVTDHTGQRAHFFHSDSRRQPFGLEG